MSENETMPSISVITATRSRPANLAVLVPAVLADAAVRHYVVVIDGDDADSVALLRALQEFDQRLVFAQIPHAGQLYAMNEGLSLTDAELVLLIDDDVIPSPGLAGAHARAHAGHHNLVLVGSMPVEIGDEHPEIGTLLYSQDYMAHVERISAGTHDVLDHLWMGNVSLRREHALAVGLASPDFTTWYHSDRDLGLRLAAAGLVGRYDSSLAAAHRHHRSGMDLLYDARRRGAGLVRLHEEHPSLGPFDHDAFLSGLPAPLALGVRLLGSSGAAPYVACALLGVSTVSGALHFEKARFALAKLARRVMLLFGTVAGEGHGATGFGRLRRRDRAASVSLRRARHRRPGRQLVIR